MSVDRQELALNTHAVQAILPKTNHPGDTNELCVLWWHDVSQLGGALSEL